MKIIVLADIHGCLDYVGGIARELAAADVVLVAGDITTFGGEPRAHRVIGALEKHNPNILAVHGNCDLPAVEEYLNACEIALDCRCVTVDGLGFAGLGGSLPVPGTTPNESSEDVLNARLEKLKQTVNATRPFVFVSHQPPWGTRLDAVDGRHTGNPTIRQFILETQPILAVSGHIHEAFATDTLGAAFLINPGPFRHGRYAVVEIQNGQVQNAHLHPL
jgi:hypothetical protein